MHQKSSLSVLCLKQSFFFITNKIKPLCVSVVSVKCCWADKPAAGQPSNIPIML